MASVSAPPFPSPSTHSYTDSSNPRKFSFRNPKFPVSSYLYSPPLKRSSSSHPSTFSSTTRVSESTRCRCQNRSDLPSTPDNNDTNLRWDSSFQDIVKRVIKRFDDYMNSIRNASHKTENLVVKEKDEGEEWDWNRWKKHFEDVEEQEKIVSVLKSQLRDAIRREDYEDAAKLKVALAAVATNDTVGRVINSLNRAIQEERYQDAAFVRDSASAGLGKHLALPLVLFCSSEAVIIGSGLAEFASAFIFPLYYKLLSPLNNLVGWWAGISKDSDQPYGRIIRISAEHGRYVARSYSPRHLATAAPGLPLFEVFLTTSSEGEYKQQAVYLKRVGGKSGDSPKRSSWLLDPGSFKPINESTLGKNDSITTSTEDMGENENRDDDSDVAEAVTRFPNILRDMIPGVRVTVLKVTAPGKVDKDLISKVIEQIIEEEEEEEDGEEDEVEEQEEEEDEEKDVELEGVDISVEVTGENIQDKNEIAMDVGGLSDTTEEQSEMALKFALSGLAENLFSSVSPKSSLIRVPAKIEKTGRLSFSFSIDIDESEEAGAERERGSPGKSATRGAQLSIDHLMTDLAKSAITKEKIPMKVLKDVGEFINLSLSQAENRQLLSGTTIFNRIEIPSSSDLLNGLYIGTHGLYSSEVIHIRRKFGQWQEDGVTDNLSNLEFYEYVEALKLVGDSYVPAGQVAFRAKVGKQYQLPHKGIIPEELGLVARYKGQGRLADPGFKNPRWVDGELVILDGKYIKGGPVVGFVYWAPEYHFLVFFHRLSLQE